MSRNEIKRFSVSGFSMPITSCQQDSHLFSLNLHNMYSSSSVPMDPLFLSIYLFLYIICRLRLKRQQDEPTCDRRRHIIGIYSYSWPNYILFCNKSMYYNLVRLVPYSTQFCLNSLLMISLGFSVICRSGSSRLEPLIRLVHGMYTILVYIQYNTRVYIQ